MPYWQAPAVRAVGCGCFGGFGPMDWMFAGLLFGGFGGFDMIGDGFDVLGDGIGDGIGAIGDGIGDGIGSIGDGIGDVFDGFDGFDF